MKIIRYHFEILGSTNTWAKEHALEFEQDALTLVTATGQTAGRGRFKRRWESPTALNIYATFCFFVDLAHSDIGHIPQLLALSAADSIELLGFQSIKIKWPNDILLSDKKVAGILCETTMALEKRCIICGIGLNINMPLEEIQKIDRPATSLLLEGNQTYEVESVLELILNNFSHSLKEFIKQGFAPFFEAFQKRSYLKLGQEVCFHDNQTFQKGTFYALNPDGSMTMCLANGKLKTFFAGEFMKP